MMVIIVVMSFRIQLVVCHALDARHFTFVAFAGGLQYMLDLSDRDHREIFGKRKKQVKNRPKVPR